ncbi:MAG: hypothetical protein MUE81_13495 [Thermoflexibacter sp.]|nr:hypothetical protein [Thermoflexibacter sp.]
MYQEQREILLLQREKYKLKIVESLIETRQKVVSTKGAFTIGGTVLAGFLAYKGLDWINNKTKKVGKNKEINTEKITAKSESSEAGWLSTLKDQAISMLLDVGKEQLQAWISKAKK